MICTNDTCSITVFVTTNMNEHVYVTYTFLPLAYYIFTLAYIILCTAIPNLAISFYSIAFYACYVLLCHPWANALSLGHTYILWNQS